MILLDANVIPELMKPRSEPRVEVWLSAQLPAASISPIGLHFTGCSAREQADRPIHQSD